MSASTEAILPVDVDPNGALEGSALGRYDVLYRLAVGGMGVVYVGRARAVAGFERLVALKVLHSHFADDPSIVSMFLDEARLAARIRHPNVVGMLDVCESEAGYFLVMEYVEGHHLFGLLRTLRKHGEGMPPAIAARIVLDALAGLTAAHELTAHGGEALHLVHRDVSPQNIMVGTDGVSRLTDFGVAKSELMHGEKGPARAGKMTYMAPEVVRHGVVEQRSDLFAMGVVLWEALTGERLFAAKDPREQLRKLLEDDIPLPSSVRPELAPFNDVVSRALSRKLEERFATARDMLNALERAAEASSGIATAREVAALVKRVAASRLARAHAAVEAALVTIGDDVLLAPPDDHLEKTPRTHVKRTDAAPRRWPLAIAALLLLGAAAGAVGIYVAYGDTARSEVVAQVPRPHAEATPSPPPSPAIPPPVEAPPAPLLAPTVEATPALEAAAPVEVAPPADTGATRHPRRAHVRSARPNIGSGAREIAAAQNNPNARSARARALDVISNPYRRR